MARGTALQSKDLATKSARMRLAPRPRPYYCRIRVGLSLGYVRREGAAGSWTVAAWANGRETTRTMGTADDLSRADGDDILTFDQATAKASGPTLPLRSSQRLTVADALDSYLTALAGRSRHADEARKRADKWIVPTLGAVLVNRLTSAQIAAWHASMVRDDEEDTDMRRRSQDSANRVLTTLKAALNAAFLDDKAHEIPTDSAWRKVKPFQNVGASRPDHFDAPQVRTLISKGSMPQFRNLCEAAFLTGARLGELAWMDVRDFDATRGVLAVTRGKTGPRSVTLSAEAVQFFRRITAKRPAAAVLLPRPDGDRWDGGLHTRPFKDAAALAELPSSASIYSLRHSHISRAIESGMPLTVLAENVGTSVAMIERNYAHVLAGTRREIIEQHAPRLRLVRGKKA